MTAAATRPRWRKVRVVLVELLVVYVAGNLFAANAITLLYRLQLTVEVVDHTTGNAIPGALVRWDAANGRPLGTTTADGRVSGETSVQQMPRWVWPAIGPLQLRGTLHVAADGYASTVVELAKELPGLSVGHPKGLVRVALGH